MTYGLNKKSPVSHTESRLLQLLAKVLPCVTVPAVLKWSVTQVSALGLRLHLSTAALPGQRPKPLEKKKAPTN